MSQALDRQAVLAAVGDGRTHFTDIVEATGLPRWQITQFLRELVDSREIVHEQVEDDGVTFPMFRRSHLWDMVNA